MATTTLLYLMDFPAQGQQQRIPIIGAPPLYYEHVDSVSIEGIQATRRTVFERILIGQEPAMPGSMHAWYQIAKEPICNLDGI